MRDGLGQLLACDAMLMGRNTYENFASMWPGRAHPWADAVNSIRKYVFSSTLERADWSNSVMVRDDVVRQVGRLKSEPGGNLLIWGHGLLGETLMRHQLIDVLDVSIHPLLLGGGKLFFREGLTSELRLIATKRSPAVLSSSPTSGTARRRDRISESLLQTVWIHQRHSRMAC